MYDIVEEDDNNVCARDATVRIKINRRDVHIYKKVAASLISKDRASSSSVRFKRMPNKR